MRPCTRRSPWSRRSACSASGLVIFLSALTELAGVLGPAVGASRRYDGPMGKSDRALVFGALGVLDRHRRAAAALARLAHGADRLLLVITIVNRVRAGLAEVSERPA